MLVFVGAVWWGCFGCACVGGGDGGLCVLELAFVFVCVCFRTRIACLSFLCSPFPTSVSIHLHRALSPMFCVRVRGPVTSQRGDVVLR